MFDPSRRKRTRRPALEMLEGRILLSDGYSVNATTGTVTITGGGTSATNLSSFLVQWSASANFGGTTTDVYTITEQNANLSFASGAQTGPGGEAFKVVTSNGLSQLQIGGLVNAFTNNNLTGAALTINNGLAVGAMIGIQSSGPGVPINVHDGTPGTIQNVTVGNPGGVVGSGLLNVLGPVNVTDSSTALTSLAINDAGDTSSNSGIMLTQTGFNTQIGSNPVITVSYNLATLTTLTFDGTGASGGGNMVTISDQGISPTPPATVAVTVTDHSGMDTIIVNSTDANSSLAINDAPKSTNTGPSDHITIGSTTVFGGPNATGLQSIQGPVTVTDKNGGLTNLTIDDTSDPAPNSGISLTGSVLSTTLMPQGKANVPVKVTYQRQSPTTSATGLTGLTFNTSNSNNVGSLVTINDQGIPTTQAIVPVVINDDSTMDQVGVTGTDGLSNLTISGLNGNQVNLGTGPGTPGSTANVAQNLLGNVTVNDATFGGPQNGIALGVFDNSDQAPMTSTISATGMTFIATAMVGMSSVPPLAINYGTALASLSIFGGSGGNTFTVSSLPSLSANVPATNLTLGSNTTSSTVNSVTVFATALTNGAALNVLGASPSDVLNLDAKLTSGLTIAPIPNSQSRVVISPLSGIGGVAAMVGTVNITDLPAPQSTPVSITATQGVQATQDVADFLLPVAPPGPVSNLNNVPVSINWGDGSAASSGSVAEDGTTPGLFHVLGAHTFSMATAANTTDSVVATITGPPTFSLNGVTISENLALPLSFPAAKATVGTASGGKTPAGPNFVTGALNPASETGTSSTSLITNDTTPQFMGTSHPGATVTLFVQGLKSFTTPTPVGTAVADASGNWSITSFALPADSYQFSIQSVDPSGSTATAALTTTAKPLVIDLTGPVIESATLNAKAKQILVVFQDSAGLNVTSLANPAAYAISGKGVGSITTLNVSGSGTVVSAAITFSTRRGFAKKLTFLVRSAIVTDVAGNHLNGTFLNHFPTGNGNPGGNFLVTLPVKIKPVKKSGGGVVVIVNP